MRLPVIQSRQTSNDDYPLSGGKPVTIRPQRSPQIMTETALQTGGNVLGQAGSRMTKKSERIGGRETCLVRRKQSQGCSHPLWTAWTGTGVSNAEVMWAWRTVCTPWKQNTCLRIRDPTRIGFCRRGLHKAFHSQLGRKRPVRSFAPPRMQRASGVALPSGLFDLDIIAGAVGIEVLTVFMWRSGATWE